MSPMNGVILRSLVYSMILAQPLYSESNGISGDILTYGRDRVTIKKPSLMKYKLNAFVFFVSVDWSTENSSRSIYWAKYLNISIEIYFAQLNLKTIPAWSQKYMGNHMRPHSVNIQNSKRRKSIKQKDAESELVHTRNNRLLGYLGIFDLHLRLWKRTGAGAGLCNKC